MKHTRQAHIARAGALAAGLLTLAACGSVGGYGGGAATNSSSTTTTPGLQVATTSLGKVVVDARGHTVYQLSADKHGTSTCSAACLAEWPAVAALGSKAAPASITAQVKSTADTSGTQMATVGGQPVYTFSGDKAAGDVNGEGLKDFGGTWSAVSPSGAAVKSGGTTSSYGY